ncbi:MAG: hypothetical protein H6752_05170 [Candidatus Omnitrophica bacterium]|nr:hypothetical protein [Candidatus Omnitrophota bacterium]
MMHRPPSSRKQTLSLISITLGLCLVTAFLAAAPSDGAQSLWNSAVHTVGNFLSGVFSGSKNQPVVVGGESDPTGSDAEGSKGLRSKNRNEILGQNEGKETVLEKSKQQAQSEDSESHGTPTPSPIGSATSTVEADLTPTQAGSTETPTPQPTITPSPSPTPTSTIVGRSLALGAIEVSPGETFTVALTCSDLMGVAGGDFEIVFDSALIDLIDVDKTEASDDFLMIAKKSETGYSISMAAMGGISSGAGALLVFKGVSSASPSENVLAPLRFSGAKLYDEESRAIPISTQDGSVAIKLKEETTPTGSTGQGEDDSPDPTPISEPTSEESAESDPTPVGAELDDSTESPSTDPLLPPIVGSTSPSNTPTPTQTLAELEPAEEIVDGTLITDLTKDGVVDHKDLFEFLKYWKMHFQNE